MFIHILQQSASFWQTNHILFLSILTPFPFADQARLREVW